MATTQPIRNKEALKKFEQYYFSVKENRRNYTLIILGLNSALRISDILGLKWKDVYDFDQNRCRNHLILREKKTGKTTCIYLNSEICRTLKAYKKDKKPSFHDFLFPGRSQNTPLSRYQAYRIIREAAEYTGLGPCISCHSLRKTFGYHAWRQGTPPALLMTIYNHSSYQTTKRYLCIDQDEKDAIFEKICL